MDSAEQTREITALSKLPRVERKMLGLEECYLNPGFVYIPSCKNDTKRSSRFAAVAERVRECGLE